MTDRIYLNAVDADGNALALAVRDGRILAIGAEPPELPQAQVTDLRGHLVLPGFVDGHIHLDKSFVGDRWHPHRPAATLRERLAIEKSELAVAPPIEARADALIAQAAAFGTVAMRSHVDVDASTGLENLHAVMAAREKWRGIVDIQLAAFPQAGVMSCPGTAQLLEAAVREGAEVVGGIDPSTLDGDAEGQLDCIFGIADRLGARLDIHLHEPGMAGVEQIGRIAARTRALGLAGRVAISHAYALGDVDARAQDEAARKLADAGVAIMTNAPGDRAFPPVLRLRAAGVRLVVVTNKEARYTARVLQALLARWDHHPKVDLITTDGFLYPTAELQRRGIMHRKGFPESYDRRKLLKFISAMKSGAPEVRAPVYSHHTYDIVPGAEVVVRSPDVLIVEGLNVLQPPRVMADGRTGLAVSDFFDFSVYVDASLEDLRTWYVERFLRLRETAFSDPSSYFRRYASLTDDEARETALYAAVGEGHVSTQSVLEKVTALVAAFALGAVAHSDGPWLSKKLCANE